MVNVLEVEARLVGLRMLAEALDEVVVRDLEPGRLRNGHILESRVLGGEVRHGEPRLVGLHLVVFGVQDSGRLPLWTREAFLGRWLDNYIL